jgi:UDP-2,4-diacetamido-2,4,6-trideoxy-beta-L-altropyranose hydrolase
MQTICILTEGGLNMGYGHITRCLSLYEVFEKCNCKIKLVINADPSVKKLLSGVEFLLCNWNNLNSEIVQVVKNSDILIIDSYHCTKELYTIFSKLSPKLAYIDDYNRITYPKGVVINGVLGAEKLGYAPNKNKEYLLGVEYAFLRKEFWNLPQKNIKKQINSVLIFCGGSDTKRVTKKVLQLLIKFYPYLDINVIVRNSEIPDIDFIKSNSKIYSNLDANMMIDLMSNSDIAITASGQTTYELSVVGTPFIPIKTAENQTFSINEFFNLGLVSDIIDHDDLDFNNKIIVEFEKLKSYRIRKERSIKLQSVVKGGGPELVVKKLLKKIN